MIAGLERVMAHRTWFVPDFVVWGLPPLGEYEYVAVEQVDSAPSVYYGKTYVGQPEQQVSFDQLADHRGNSLPATLSAPRVIPRLKGSDGVFVVGKETSEGFKIARDADTETPVTVDLMIVELGD